MKRCTDAAIDGRWDKFVGQNSEARPAAKAKGRIGKERGWGLSLMCEREVKWMRALKESRLLCPSLVVYC